MRQLDWKPFAIGVLLATAVMFGAGAAREKPERPRASIHRAARQGEVEDIKQHLFAGSDVNEVSDSTGRIALHSASLHNRVFIVEILIDNGSKLNVKDGTGLTPLHLSVLGGHKVVAKLLIDAGALLNAENMYGETPLDTALKEFRFDSAKIKEAKKETANLLRKHGGKTGEELKAEGK
jgi:ankyrin repeat protein